METFYKFNIIDPESRNFVYHFDDIYAKRRPFNIYYRNMIDGGKPNHFVALLPKNLNVIFQSKDDYYNIHRRFGDNIPYS